MSFTWPVDRSGLPALPDPPITDEDIAAALERNAAENLAVAILYYLSGRRFGLYETTVRPCRAAYSASIGGADFGSSVTSYVVSWEGDHWINLGCGCSGGCSLTGPRAVHLPGPVDSVTEVKIAGVLIPEEGYVLEGDVLYRVGGPWPRQDLGRPNGEVNTWSVTYLRGLPVPRGVDQLTGELANEILKALSGADGCRLPRTVTTVTRQGVTYRAYDPAAIYASGKVGISVIDMWLASVNPRALMSAPTVL